MKNAFCFTLFLVYGFACAGQAAHTTAAKPQHPAAAPGPMSCAIEGKIVRIIPPSNADSGTVCAKYPCRAMVKIMSVFGCGSSVSQSLAEGDTVTMRFVYTLHKTASLFPKMKVQYPGLKKGNKFTATAEERLKPGTQAEFIIFDYKLK